MRLDVRQRLEVSALMFCALYLGVKPSLRLKRSPTVEPYRQHGRDRSPPKESRPLPYFLLIDDNEMPALVDAVNLSIQSYQRQLGEILHERIAMVKQGETRVIGWKADRHDELLKAIDRLDTFGDKLRALPSGKDRDPA